MEEDTIREMRKLRSEGKTIREISRECNIRSTDTVHKYVKDVVVALPGRAVKTEPIPNSIPIEQKVTLGVSEELKRNILAMAFLRGLEPEEEIEELLRMDKYFYDNNIDYRDWVSDLKLRIISLTAMCHICENEFYFLTTMNELKSFSGEEIPIMCPFCESKVFLNRENMIQLYEKKIENFKEFVEKELDEMCRKVMNE
jgi:hypothetical protein